ncbi:multiple sugar transport system permease protein [Microbacterium terrae]|uniref:Sn-glycerol-3-phosphate transport system permease protein UgpA n=1 Tax=Microbacterium terrae TaxID=69369 RepID=A0A0M2H9A8_9MICO|nr:sugar ABC transporter permease [Microbacterium terrae]KJL42991.1 sn-glycerol-3-phosphate transport system permease protein UgpA [Microbacterium terrae]MBP1079315.1 multiple sugar transport system permease protein [Microbacterium terrae]
MSTQIPTPAAFRSATRAALNPKPDEPMRSKREVNRLHRVEHRWAFAFMVAPIIGFLAFTAYPLGYAIYASLTRWNGLGQMTFIGFENYVRLFKDQYFLTSLWNTAFYMIGIPIGLALSLLLALALNRGIFGQTAFRTIYYVPVISSLAAVAIVWQFAYNGDYGLINQFLAIFGIQGPDWLQNTATVKPAIIIMAVWKGLGYSTLLYLAAIQSVPASLIEAAKLDGANATQRVWTIVVPMVRPVTFFLVVTNIIGGAQLFTEVNIMTPNGGPEFSSATVVWYVFRQAFRYQEMGYATAMAVVLGILIFVVTLIQFRLNKRNDFSIE